MKAAFYTLGCKVNQYETEYMIELLKTAGYEIVNSNCNADVFVINSCTVTATANQKTRQNIRKFKRNNPNSIVVLTGCMPQAFPEESSAISEADIVISNKDDQNIIDVLNNYFENKQRIVSISKHNNNDTFDNSSISSFSGRSRAFLKVEDGCNRFCSYCIIPYARGRVRSKPLDTIKKEIIDLANNGVKEIVLVGINLTSYGTDFEENIDISDVVKICCQNENILRVRLGSLEPDNVTERMLNELSKINKFCPQFHMSLQSGCDKTLNSMNRQYTTEEYKNICNLIRAKFDHASITTDLMVGFCDESDEDFSRSIEFVKEIGFEKIHIFPYSNREGTYASKHLKDNVNKHTKESRAKEAIELGKQIRLNLFNNLVNTSTSVLIENFKNGKYLGYTKNYLPVEILSANKLDIGKELEINITDFDIKKDILISEYKG